MVTVGVGLRTTRKQMLETPQAVPKGKKSPPMLTHRGRNGFYLAAETGENPVKEADNRLQNAGCIGGLAATLGG